MVRGIDAAERRVRAALPMAEVIYLEPDIYQESKADQTDPAMRTVSRAGRVHRPGQLPRNWPAARHRPPGISARSPRCQRDR